MQQFKVESGIAIPGVEKQTKNRYPWAEMKLGDSFFVPAKNQSAAMKRVKAAVKYYRASNRGFRILCRRVDGGIRVWRVKRPVLGRPHLTTVLNVVPIRNAA